jgi:hypothetical protein
MPNETIDGRHKATIRRKLHGKFMRTINLKIQEKHYDAIREMSGSCSMAEFVERMVDREIHLRKKSSI